MHGYLSLVIPARRGDEPCVLKVAWDAESTRQEAVALAAWAGQGAARLLAAEPTLGALALERLDFSRTLNDLGIEEAVGVAGRLLRRLAIPAPAGLPTLPTVAGELVRTLPERWERLGRPLPRRWLDQARDLALQLGGSAEELLVNYDLHYADVLASERAPWLAVDPRWWSGRPSSGSRSWCGAASRTSRRGAAWTASSAR
jgi:streptomycin 6-kinase